MSHKSQVLQRQHQPRISRVSRVAKLGRKIFAFSNMICVGTASEKSMALAVPQPYVGFLFRYCPYPQLVGGISRTAFYKILKERQGRAAKK